MVDKKAMRSITYGLYLISSQVNGVEAGCTVNTFMQVTSKPLQACVAVNKENYTASIIKESGTYAAVALAQSASMDLIGRFGFSSSADVDKFTDFATAHDAEGNPYVCEQIVARYTVRVNNSIDTGTHIIFIGEVVEAEVLSDEKPMSYAYYHEVKGGKTPPKASSYLEESDTGSGDAGGGMPYDSDAPAEKGTDSVLAGENKTYAWQCSLCGHIEYVDELPDDFICPICGRGKDHFERIELT